MERMGIKSSQGHAQRAIDRDRNRKAPRARNLELHMMQSGDSQQENARQLAIVNADS